MEKSKLEWYIDKIKSWWEEFEFFMKKAYFEKKNSNHKEWKLNIIKNQINTIEKVLKHTTFYRNNFLNKIFDELYIQLEKSTVKATIKLYLSSEYRNKAEKFQKKFNILWDDYKKSIHDLNLHIDSFFLSLNTLIDVLKNQADFLNKQDKKSNYNKINKIKQKVLWDFDDNLLKEEKIF